MLEFLVLFNYTGFVVSIYAVLLDPIKELSEIVYLLLLLQVISKFNLHDLYHRHSVLLLFWKLKCTIYLQQILIVLTFNTKDCINTITWSEVTIQKILWYIVCLYSHTNEAGLFFFFSFPLFWGHTQQCFGSGPRYQFLRGRGDYV